MVYIFPVLYVIFSYGFFIFAGASKYAGNLDTVILFAPAVLGIINLVMVLTVGKNWSRKTLLNCTLITKYGLIPFYLLGGSFIVSLILLACFAYFPLPFISIAGILVVIFLLSGLLVLFGSAPYAIAYIVRSYKEEIHPKGALIAAGICQFFFLLDILSVMALTLKERHKVKTTIAVFVLLCLSILSISLMFYSLYAAA